MNLLFISLVRQRDERRRERAHVEKDKIGKGFKRAVRRDEERQTLRTVFRSSFNN